MDLIILVIVSMVTKIELLERRSAQGLLRPPETHKGDARKSDALGSRADSFHGLDLSGSVEIIAKMDGPQKDPASLSHFSSSDSSLTSPSLHSPASMHSTSNPWDRRSLPGQVRTGKNSSLRSYDPPTSRTNTWRVRSSCHVPHT